MCSNPRGNNKRKDRLQFEYYKYLLSYDMLRFVTIHPNHCCCVHSLLYRAHSLLHRAHCCTCSLVVVPLLHRAHSLILRAHSLLYHAHSLLYRGGAHPNRNRNPYPNLCVYKHTYNETGIFLIIIKYINIYIYNCLWKCCQMHFPYWPALYSDLILT